MSRFRTIGLASSMLCVLLLGFAAGRATVASHSAAGGSATTMHGQAASLTVPNPAISILGVESFKGTAGLGAAANVHLGTGFVLQASDGSAWVATAAHVVTSDEAVVFLPGSSTPHVADRVVRDATDDVAFLHVPRLYGVVPVQLGGTPTGTRLAEVSCVRFPSWTYQAYPVDLDGHVASASNDLSVLTTPALAVLPGCSGGPLTAYPVGGTPVVAGLVVQAMTKPAGVGFVPAAVVDRVARQLGVE